MTAFMDPSKGLPKLPSLTTPATNRPQYDEAGEPTPFDDMGGWLAKPQAQQERISPTSTMQFGQRNDLLDVAQGAFVEFGRTLSAGIGRFVPGDDFFEGWASYLQTLKDNNPQWRPQQIDSAWDLISSPSKLAESIVTQIPYMGSNLALMAGGFALGGPAGAAISQVGPFAISFLVEGQNAYEDAIAYGATQSEAEFAGNVTGAISGMIEVMQLGSILRFGRGVKQNIVRTAAQRALKGAEGMFAAKLAKPTIELAKELATQSLEEMLQGVTQESVAYQVYGKKIEDGFLDRRMQEAIGASASTIFFGLGQRGYHKVVGGKPVVKAAMAARDSEGPVYDAFSFAADMRNKFNYKDEEIDAVLAVTDARAQVWGEATGQDPSLWYQTHLAGVSNNIEQGDALFQDSKSVMGMYLKSGKVIQEMPDKLNGKQARTFLQKAGVKKEELVWTGLEAVLSEKEESNQSFSKEELAKTLSESQFHLQEITQTTPPQEILDRIGELEDLRNENYDRYITKRKGLLGLVFDALPDPGVIPHGELKELVHDAQSHLELNMDPSVMVQLLDKFQLDPESRAKIEEESTATAKLRRQGAVLYDEAMELSRAGTTFGYLDSTYTGANNYREILIQTNSKTAIKAAEISQEDNDSGKVPGEPAKVKDTAPTTHWSKDNIIFHIRTTDKTDMNTGKKVLFVEEIQSDWAQKRRQDIAEVKAGKRAYQTDKSKPPFADTNRKLAFKHLLNMAIAEGYEQIGFMNGNLSAEINSLNSEPDTSGRNRRESRLAVYDEMLPRDLQEVMKELGVDQKLTKALYHVQVARPSLDQTSDSEFVIDRTEAFNAVDITPELISKVNEGMSLFQEGHDQIFSGPRAAVQFAKDGKAWIRALTKPDVTSVLHEVGHIFRRDLYALAESDLVQDKAQIVKDINDIETIYGVKNGNWTRENEEALAQNWEKYLSNGRAPSQPLIKYFKKLKDWFRKLYASSANSPLGVKYNKNMTQIFDRLLSKDSVEVSVKRDELGVLHKEQTKQRSQRLGLKPSQEDIAIKAMSIWETLGRPQGLDTEIWYQAESTLLEAAGAPLKEINAKVKEKMGELRDLLETTTIKDTRPLLAQGDEALIEFLKTESIETRHKRNILSRAKDKIGAYVSMALPLNRTKAGRMTVDILNNMQSEVRNMSGRFAEPIAKAVGQLSKADWKWLYQDPGNLGLPNIVRMIDQTGTPLELQVAPPNERLKTVYHTLAEIQDYTGREAESVGVMQRLQDGSLQPFRRPKFLKLPRIPTDDMWQALGAKSGPMYEALKAAVLKMNPDIKTFGNKDELLLGPYGELTVKRNKSLEESRTIKVMPYYVYLQGKAVEIFRTNPLDMMNKAVEFQARRISYVKNFGLAGVLNKVTLNTVSKAAKLMGINMGKVTDDLLKQRIVTSGVPMEKLDGIDGKELRAYAREQGVSVGWSLDDYIGKLEKLNPNKMLKRDLKQLEKLAKKLEGINLRQDHFGMFQDVLKRLKEPLIDTVQELRSKHVQEAGYEGAGEAFDNVLTVWQGLPYHWFKRGTASRVLRATSSLIGSMQTSLSVAPNIPQTMALVPRFTGLTTFLEATANVMKDPGNTMSQIAGLGAMPIAINSWALEKGYYVEGLGRNVRQAMGEATGLRAVSELNNMIAGEAFRIMADSWQKHGATLGDAAVAKALGMNAKDIAAIQQKGFSDDLVAKVVQIGVAKTQFVTEAPHLKGKLENIPLLRTLFAYSNYTLGQTRAMFNMVGQWKSAVRNIATGNGSWRESFRVIHSMLANVTGLMGAGVAGSILRGALKGQLTGEDEEPLGDRLLGGMVEVQMFGAAQRMLEPMQHSNGVIEKGFVGTMPHVKAVMDGLGALFRMDKYADFGTGDRALAAAKKNFPLFSTITGRRPTEVDWLENFAYPELQEYSQARTRGWNWIERQPIVSRYAQQGIKERKGAGYAPINPDFDRVYQWVIRGQKEEAKEAVTALVEKVRSERGDVLQILSNLRSSLANRSPLPMSLMETSRYLRSLPQQQKKDTQNADREYNRIVNMVAPSFR